MMVRYRAPTPNIVRNLLILGIGGALLAMLLFSYLSGMDRLVGRL